MPGVNQDNLPTFSRGGDLTAADLNRIVDALRQQKLVPGSFQTGSFFVQRPVGVASIGSGSGLRWGTISTTGSAASVEGTPSTDGRIDLYEAYGGDADVPFNNYYPEIAPERATAAIDGDGNILPWSCTLWP